MSSIEHLQSITLELPPSCIEFCPNHPQYAVIGTYNFEKQDEQELDKEEGQRKSQQRNGSLILIEVDGDSVKLLHTLSTPSAILDVHFLDKSSNSLFGVATSTGSMSFYNLLVSLNNEPRLVHRTTVQYFPEDVLVTAFAWHPNGHTLGMTLSSGQVCLAHFDGDISDIMPRHVKTLTHDLEAWTLAFLPDGSGVLSGGDDCALRFTDLATSPIEAFNGTISEPEYYTAKRSPWADNKTHGAGVTAILPIHCDDVGILVITGSYDDHIRLVYAPSIGRRQVLSESNLGGGVWRLKVLDRKPPVHQDSGARIVRLFRSEDDWQFEVLAKFEEHQSMNYGSDFQPDSNERGQRTIISTSFYDRLLCLWRH